MFKGRRDPEVRLVVPQDKCNNYTSKNGGSWIEISIPPETVDEYSSVWGSIMVDKKQIDNLCREYGYDNMNSVRLNDDADIVVSTKDANHVVIESETLKTMQLVARWLKYYRWNEFGERYPELKEDLDRPSIDMLNDMLSSGQTMLGYINRLPKVLPKQYTMEELVVEDPLAGLLSEEE